MTDQQILPWHETAWQRLAEAATRGRLPHGLLLRGPTGLGKGLFAKALAARLLCSAGAQRACGTCRGCRLLASGSHPDFFRVTPDEDKVQIRVEQVRVLIERLGLTSQFGRKVAIIEPADALNTSAQNSLLKTLEEPPADTHLILVSGRPAALAATVLSRCQTVRFACPDRETATAWLSAQAEADWDELLQMAWGAPLRALRLAEDGAAELGGAMADELGALMACRTDAVSVAESWAASRSLVRLQWLQQQVYGVIQWRMLGHAPELVHKTLQRSLQKRIADFSLTESYRYLDQVQRVIGMVDRSVNQTLAILPLLTVWADGPRFERAADTL